MYRPAGISFPGLLGTPTPFQGIHEVKINTKMFNFQPVDICTDDEKAKVLQAAVTLVWSMLVAANGARVCHILSHHMPMLNPCLFP